jgi:hypothetical protein
MEQQTKQNNEDSLTASGDRNTADPLLVPVSIQPIQP